MTKYIATMILVAAMVVLMGCAQASGGTDPVEPPVDPAITYTVTFDVNGGNAVATLVAEENTTVNLPAATRTGYTFDGWDTNADGAADSNSVTLTSNMTAKALWTVNRYTITFDECDDRINLWDTDVTSITAEYGTVVELPSRSNGHVTYNYSNIISFDGWSATKDDWDGTADYPTTYTMGASNVTLYIAYH